MPTYATTRRFKRDFDTLTAEQRTAFKGALGHFIEDLKNGGPFRKGLRVKGIRGADGVFEMTWAGNGRATFEYGDAVVGDEPHIVWRRCGGHEIFDNP